VTYVPVVLLENPSDAQVYTDSAVPWDFPAMTVTYRVTGYRNSDHLTVTTVTAGWNNVATAPGAAFGLAAPNGNLYAYVPVDPSRLVVKWNPLNPVQMVPLFGVNYQIPLRAPEERGLETQFMVVVDSMLVCGSPPAQPWDETIAPGPSSMSPTPFAQLRQLAKTDTFSLLLPGGFQQFVTMNLGSLTIETVFGVYLGDISLVYVPDITIDPWAPGS
jgi:hypothetical protein